MERFPHDQGLWLALDASVRPSVLRALPSLPTRRWVRAGTCSRALCEARGPALRISLYGDRRGWGGARALDGLPYGHRKWDLQLRILDAGRTSEDPSFPLFLDADPCARLSCGRGR